MAADPGEAIRLFLCGDVMTGRGIDQILPHAVNPVLYESYVRDAREYVQLAERASGPIPRGVDFGYIWGDALAELIDVRTDLRIINLETSITSSEDFWPEKEVLYRMHPRNIGCIQAARIDCCCLANNHVLDWGYAGLTETLLTLENAKTARAGAGVSRKDAAAPAVLDVTGRGRVLVFAMGSTTSGIPPEWAATEFTAGVNWLPDLSTETARHVASQMRQHEQTGDVLIASIHWGGNWGYRVPDEQISFAHQLIDGGVDIVHGHSSHHVKGIELYRDRLILYGCGDFLTDYEGISGQERYRGDLALMYMITVDPCDGRLAQARLVPVQTRRLRLTRASAADAKWLSCLLNELSAVWGTQTELRDDNSMNLHWR